MTTAPTAPATTRPSPDTTGVALTERELAIIQPIADFLARHPTTEGSSAVELAALKRIVNRHLSLRLAERGVLAGNCTVITVVRLLPAEDYRRALAQGPHGAAVSGILNPPAESDATAA